VGDQAGRRLGGTTLAASERVTDEADRACDRCGRALAIDAVLLSHDHHDRPGIRRLAD
jgi:phosphoribosyl 1,2-cyclic phosphodiesterase